MSAVDDELRWVDVHDSFHAVLTPQVDKFGECSIIVRRMFGIELRKKTIDIITNIYLIWHYLEFGTLNHLSLIFRYVPVILESE